MNVPNKVVKTSLSDQVSQSIKDRITSGELAVGSKLPSEAELASMFGVSRLTVRMALQKLSAQGLVETRAGDGSFVRQFDFQEYLSEVSDVLVKPEILDDVYEFRRCIELECIRLAVENATEQDLERLQAIVNQLDGFVSQRNQRDPSLLQAYVELDYAFHEAVCEISGNSLFRLAYAAAKKPILMYLSMIVGTRLRKTFENNPDIQEVVIEGSRKCTHQHIVNCIKARDYKGCEVHYLQLSDYKEARKGG